MALQNWGHCRVCVSDASGRKMGHNDGLVQDRSNSSALAMELLESAVTPMH